MSTTDKQRSFSATTMRGSAITFGAQWGGRMIGLVSSVVLARMLTPSDFGIVALAATVPAMLNAFTSISPESYLLRADTLDRPKLDTAFTISLARGSLVSLLVLSAAVVAAFVDVDPRLAPVLLWLALAPLIESLSNPRAVEFARAMDFSFIPRCNIISKLAGSITSIVIAIAFRSYWALVIGVVVRALTWTGMTYVVRPYRPRMGLADWRDALGFSIWLGFRTMIDMLGKQGDRLIVARAGIATVGNFAVAKDFAWITAAEFFDAVQNVLFPVLGKFRHKPKELQANVLEAYELLVCLALPWTIGAALVGPQAVLVIYGAKWIAAATIVTPLAVALAFQSTDTIASALVLAVGNPRSLMIRSAVTTMLRLSLLTVGLIYFDLYTAMWLLVPVSLVTAVMNMALVKRLTRLPAKAFLRSTWRSWVAVGTMAAAVVGIGYAMPTEQGGLALLGDIVVKAAVGTSVYAGVHLILWALTGRPEGPERRILKVTERVWSRIRPLPATQEKV